MVASVRTTIAATADQWVDACRSDQRTDSVETLASELIPLAGALKWIGRHGENTLRPRRVGLAGRPAWLWGIRSQVERVPLGTVLVLGTWNYPYLLAGVQIAQALAAGNCVFYKPAPGADSASRMLVSAFHEAGVPSEALVILDSDIQSAQNAISEGVDLVVLTGAAETGRKVMTQAAHTLTPSIMELSGIDAAIVMPCAQVDRVVDAMVFGLMLNGGATCIAPRRLIMQHTTLGEEVVSELVGRLTAHCSVTIHPSARESVAKTIKDAIAAGAADLIGSFDESRLRSTGEMAPVVLTDVPENHRVLNTDLFAPVTSVIQVASMEDAISLVNGCSYRLAAAVFGGTSAAQEIASRLHVGTVTINDLIMPTADPRLPFGGRGESGFGVTRGPEGLLAMTTPRVISTRRGKFAIHLLPRKERDSELLTGLLQFQHASGFRQRLAGLRRLITAATGGKPEK